MRSAARACLAGSPSVSADPGALIVLTAPLTEIVDHAGYFIQMALASLPPMMERVIDRQYPRWRELQRAADGSALYMPAGLRAVEAALGRVFSPADVVACNPGDLHRFIGPRTRAVGVSTHNPLGMTFAAGVYASIFGSSRQPINAVYARRLFDDINANPYRSQFKVIVGGAGGWQITETHSGAAFGVDCVVEGRGESADALALFRRAVEGSDLPPVAAVAHPTDVRELVVPEKRTTFGVVEMTTGCGRRCRFCLPDRSPQMDVPKDRILAAVRANVRDGNRMISLATEDMFIWGQVRTSTPFYFPNREALLDLFASTAAVPGVDHILLSHATLAPAVVDPELIRRLSDVLLPKSPLTMGRATRRPDNRILSPLIGVETGSVRLARALMPAKAAPFPIEEWPSVVIRGLEVMNASRWFPVMTLMVGNPGETDEDCEATLDLLYEVERRDLFAFFVPSVFTPLRNTRLATSRGVVESRQMSRLQWQVIMKAWQIVARPAIKSRWSRAAWRAGAVGMWAWKLRRSNGPNFTWPLMLFAGVIPERLLARAGRVYPGRPMSIKSRAELLATIKAHHQRFLRGDCGDSPAAEDNPQQATAV
jgi:radical SAM superfamily enzyme YgiQ (UPF0313 family)